MGLSYTLAGIGYFMLFELFVQVDSDATPLAVLVTLTGLPVLLDVASLASTTLLAILYEPIGVAAFALGSPSSTSTGSSRSGWPPATTTRW